MLGMNEHAIKSLSNIHTHTTFADGRDTPEKMVRAALALGFHTLGFSEHGYADYDDCCMKPDQEPLYRAEVLRLRKEYTGQIKILLGYEHDWFSPVYTSEYDYYIESVHYLPGGDSYAYTAAYFRRLGQWADTFPGQIVGHADLVTKFTQGGTIADGKLIYTNFEQALVKLTEPVIWEEEYADK